MTNEKKYLIYSKKNSDFTFEGKEGWSNTSKSEPTTFSKNDAEWLINHMPEDEKELAELWEVEEESEKCGVFNRT